jgi:hypothetical protein
VDYSCSEAGANLCLTGEVRQSAFSHHDVTVDERHSVSEEVETIVLVWVVLAFAETVIGQLD